jgi:hypothetical protein
VVMMIVVMVPVVMPIVVVVMMMVVIVLGHDHWLVFGCIGSSPRVLSAQDLLGIGDGIQQLGKRLRGLEQVGLVCRRRGGRLRAAKESER